VKKVDSHNAALLAKEAQEKAEKAKRIRAERKMEAFQVHIQDRSRDHGRLCEEGYENGRGRRRRDHGGPEGEESDSKRRRNRSRARSPDREKRHRSRHRSGDRDRSKTRRHRSHRGDKDRRERDSDKSSARSDKSSSRAKDERTRRGSHDKSSRDSHHRHRHRHRQSSSHVRTKHHAQDHGLHRRREMHNQSGESSEGPTSDPLEAMIGPAPLSRARGRGASGASAMDARFDEGYDPSQDGRPDPNPKDISDAAIQAYRERQKSKAMSAARMRQVGLSEDFINSWADRDKKDTESIQWKGKGKVREWDRGKVVGGSGETLLTSPWANS